MTSTDPHDRTGSTPPARRVAEPAARNVQPNPGRIPPRYRRFVMIFGGCIFAVLLVAGVLLKVAGDIDIPWFWIAAAPFVIAALIFAFLWVRLSD